MYVMIGNMRRKMRRRIVAGPVGVEDWECARCYTAMRGVQERGALPVSARGLVEHASPECCYCLAWVRREVNWSLVPNEEGNP